MAGLSGTDDQDKRAQQIENDRRKCLYNVVPMLGFADAQAPALKMPCNWQWRDSLHWQDPPKGWKFPDVKVPPEIKVEIKSARNKDYMAAPDGAAMGHWIYCNGDPLKWVVVGDKDHAMFRLDSAPLFLSDRLTTGAVKLHDTASDAEYKQDSKRTIFNLRDKDYMWLDDKSPYVSSKGDPRQDPGPWVVDSLPGS